MGTEVKALRMGALPSRGYVSRDQQGRGAWLYGANIPLLPGFVNTPTRGAGCCCTRAEIERMQDRVAAKGAARSCRWFTIGGRVKCRNRPGWAQEG